MSEYSKNYNGLPPSRRRFLEAVGLGAAGLFLSCTPQKPSVSKVTRTRIMPELAVNNSIIQFESKQRYDLGIRYYPDGHLPFITTEDNERVMMVSHSKDGHGLSSPFLVNESGDLRPIRSLRHLGLLNDQGKAYMNGYAAVTGMWRMNGGAMYGVAHYESWATSDNGFPFTASVGLVRSLDSCRTFEDMGVLISGRESIAPEKIIEETGVPQVTGAGQPCVVVRDEGGKRSAYIYYIEWRTQETKDKDGAGDQIYLAKAELGSTKINKLEFLTGGKKWSKEQKDLKPIMLPPGEKSDSRFAAVPSVSFNNHLKQFLMTFETDRGIYIAKSGNGIDFGVPEMILQFNNRLSEVFNPSNFDGSRRKEGYASLLSFDEDSDQTTNKRVSLVFAERIGPGSSHSMVRYDGVLK